MRLQTSDVPWRYGRYGKVATDRHWQAVPLTISVNFAFDTAQRAPRSTVTYLPGVC